MPQPNTTTIGEGGYVPSAALPHAPACETMTPAQIEEANKTIAVGLNAPTLLGAGLAHVHWPLSSMGEDAYVTTPMEARWRHTYRELGALRAQFEDAKRGIESMTRRLEDLLMMVQGQMAREVLAKNAPVACVRALGSATPLPDAAD